MDRIQLLDDNLINKIAAGEVVERPASVVKELVENALDAGATKITIDIQEGGRKRILVSDNGCGMSSSDATKSLLRHATSKIRTQEDLFNLNTMGFRGEALASISAVCRFTLMTCEQGKAEGVKLQVAGDGNLSSSPWQSSGGTTIICDDLFFNVPVRQKFLKAAASEYGAILELAQAVALANLSVDFTVVHNGKEVLRAPSVSDKSVEGSEKALRMRFSQVMRGDAGLAMIHAKAESQWGSLTALVSAPGVERTSAKDMFLFVNGRWVKDKSLRFAVLRGYHSHLLRGRYPVVALFLNIDSGLVDVNVHPAKTEVRIQYASEIHSMIASAVRDAIRKGEWAAAPTHPLFASSQASLSLDSNKDSDRRIETSSERHLSDRNGSRPPVWRDVTPNFARSSVTMPVIDGLGETDSKAPWSSTFSAPEVSNAAKAMQSIPWEELNFLGSIADCYLLFAHGDRASGARLLAVDQHAFHERVIYERLIRDENLLKASQPLLVPECVQLTPKAIETLKEVRGKLQQNGFSYDILNDTTIEVRALPVLLVKGDVTHLMEEIAEQSSRRPHENNAELMHEMLSTFACHAAVKAGERIGHEELKVLIREASEVDFYHNCPHGRRVFRWWDEAQIARWFDR